MDDESNSKYKIYKSCQSQRLRISVAIPPRKAGISSKKFALIQIKKRPRLSTYESCCNPAQKSRHFKRHFKNFRNGIQKAFQVNDVSSCNPAQKSRHFKQEIIIQKYSSSKNVAIPPRKAGISSEVSQQLGHNGYKYRIF